MSTISVIIPCYRDSKTLALALNSVYAQTRLPDEVIVVNDCSPETEQIENVLLKYPDVVYLVNESNAGPSISRNIGIENSECEIVSFLDADDELHPQKIEFQLAVLSSKVVVSCANRRIRLGGRPHRSLNYSGPGRIRKFTETSQIIFRHRLTGASIMAYKADLKTVGGYDSSLRSGEDYDLWLRLLDSGFTVFHLPQSLYLYRENINGLSRDISSVSYWEMEMIRNALKRRNLSPPFEGKAAVIWSLWTLKHIVRNCAARSEDLDAQIDRDLSALPTSSLVRGMLMGLRSLLNVKIS